MPEQPVISVLMPCYNAAATLPEALQSLQAQTLENIEMVCVDDGSTDDTRAILEAIAETDPRLRILAGPHGGIVQALNLGLQACRAPLVARMDADDLAHPQRLEKQAAFLEQHPQVCLVASQVSGFPDDQVQAGMRSYIDWQNSLLTDEDIRREMFVESPLTHPSVIFRKDLILQAGSYRESGWAEDYDLWLRLYLAGARFAKLDEVLLWWRDAPDRLTRLDGRYSLENFLRLKAHYLALGPLAGRDAVFLWGAGMTGRRLCKHLARLGAPIRAFFDVDPRKIGRTRRRLPVFGPAQMLEEWHRYDHPVMLAAVGTRGARGVVRSRFENFNLIESVDWWFAA